jgi:hypothetical protein
VSATVYVQGAGYSIVAADEMTQHDAVKIINDSQENVQFITLAATIREPLAPKQHQVFLTYNYDDLLDASIKKLRRRRIVRPPGSMLVSFADFFYSSKTIDRIVTPNISDMRIDYYKALPENNKLKLAVVRIRGYWGFWKALGLHSIAKNIAEIWKISRLG